MKHLLRLAYWLYRLRWLILRPITVGVRLMLVRDGQVLLVRHSYQDHWYFPGGAVKRGETLVDAAQREAAEEAGVTVQSPPRLLGMYSNFYERKSDHIAVFVSQDFQVGEATDRWEIEACQFFALDALPEDLAPGCARRIADYLAGPGPYAGAW
ncbi:MAG: NUDIX domain-containing protein [Caldilineaceae bacterium]